MQLDQIQKMIGDKALVRLLPMATKTAGGILLPEVHVDNHLSQMGTVLALGDGTEPDGDRQPWDIEVGQVIAMATYVNRPFLMEGEKDLHLVYQREILGEIIGMTEDTLA